MIGRYMILIASYYVYILIARIPVVIVEFRCPHINQIMYTFTHQITLHKQIQLLEGFGAITTPPEPCGATTVGITGCFVKRAPYNGDTLFLVVKQQIGDTLQITHQDCILGCSSLQCFTRRKSCTSLWCLCCRRRIERIPLTICHLCIYRDTPVPDKANNTTRLIPIPGSIGHIVNMLHLEMLEVKDIDCRIFTRVLTYLIGIGSVIIPPSLATGENPFAPNIVPKIVIQTHDLFSCLLIYRFRGYWLRQTQEGHNTQ